MADGPDPLGKRALYWMPIDQQKVSDIDPDPLVGQSRGSSTHPTPARSHARPAGKHALFSEATPSGEAVAATSTATATDPLPPRGLLSVGCSSCGSITRVGMVQFLLLHFPVGVWLPGRSFDRWMTCPACRRHTWTSVTLSRWS